VGATTGLPRPAAVWSRRIPTPAVPACRDLCLRCKRDPAQARPLPRGRASPCGPPEQRGSAHPLQGASSFVFELHTSSIANSTFKAQDLGVLSLKKKKKGIIYSKIPDNCIIKALCYEHLRSTVSLALISMGSYHCKISLQWFINKNASRTLLERYFL